VQEPLALAPLVRTQWFGVLASMSLSISVWLLTTSIVHCSTVSDDTGSKVQCKRDTLGGYLIEYKMWPYQHTPFFGYWDSYDNKLAMLLEEPYSQLFLMTAMTYLVWLRIVIYVRSKNRKKRIASANN
jgi:hypothetical protein